MRSVSINGTAELEFWSKSWLCVCGVCECGCGVAN